ncbi:D-alanyl-D-alanine carboxypeptidase [Domibacillus sp. PGB-M46]|nr:D-alanyl-D-alanine carboxypeptidase family protein [Domibacillus sp. PGB-M46]MCI2256111.1 D-alanyl-D-alanine carboxypeptidase [Domibacillus sp. PGB-M46]
MEKCRCFSMKFIKNEKAVFKKITASTFITSMLILPVTPFSSPAEISAVAAEETNDTASAKADSVPSADSLNLHLKSAVLMEPTTGKVLLSVNADTAYAPASMTKMMTEYIVMDKVKKGEISWNDTVTVKANADQTIGASVHLAEGEQHTVKELYTAMALHSANDAAVALAEFAAGSEAEFVKLMNEEAKRMGMTKTHYINATGLDRSDMPAAFRPAEEKETKMSAMDVAKLVQHIIQDQPEFSDFTSLQTYQFRETDAEPLVNSDWMLEANKNDPELKKYAYEGLDGLKTGYTTNAGYCFAGTAERDGMRLISVVMGAETMGSRFTETKKVLDYGFDHFEVQQVVAAKSSAQEEKAPVLDGKETEVSVVPDQTIHFVVPKGVKAPNLVAETDFLNEDLTAPLKEGIKAGTVTYTYRINGVEGAQTQTVNLVTSEEVEKAGWLRLMFRSMGHFSAGIFSDANE